MKLILFVLNDPAKLQDLLDAWRQAGASGATVLFSTGMGRLHQSANLREDLPLMPSLSDFDDRDEKLSRTLFIVIRDELVESIISATERVVGDLCKPRNGILVVLPADSVHGLIEYGSQTPWPE
jgi:nitrogen regulatory protein P-II 1